MKPALLHEFCPSVLLSSAPPLTAQTAVSPRSITPPNTPTSVNSLTVSSLSFYVSLIEFSSSVLCGVVVSCEYCVACMLGIWKASFFSFFSVVLHGAVFASLLLQYHNLITSSKHHIPGWAGLQSSRLTGCTASISSVPLGLMPQKLWHQHCFSSSTFISQNIYWNAIILFKSFVFAFYFFVLLWFLGTGHPSFSLLSVSGQIHKAN